ncbi:MAG: L-fucose/L-arabinose isomerase family protein [Verrucomicrobia bacterium]|nr:L-fucose/L-arabinose isomerase family protein [Verrucomicrobiota bacterium]
MKHILALSIFIIGLSGWAATPEEEPETAQVKVGIFSVGLDTYWEQFDGLKSRLNEYRRGIEKRLKRPGVNVVSAGLVDTVDRANAAADLFRSEGVNIVFLYVSTYALSSTILPVVQELNVPVVVLNLQPGSSIDYESFNAMNDRGKMTGEWLAWCQACSMPEISNVFHRSGIPFHQITGTLKEPEVWKEIDQWVEAARVDCSLEHTRLGILGHYYNGMLDVYSDPTRVTSTFGTHVVHLEMSELQAYRRQVSADAIQEKLGEFYSSFEVLDECKESELERAARTACALDRLAEENRLGAIAYYYEGTPGSHEENIVTSIIAGTSLLTAQHVPVAGECEVKNAMAMKIMDLFGAGGSFSEFYVADYDEDVVLLGHDGPGHPGIAEGKPILKPLGVFHGKPGKGVSIEMKVKTGPVTLLAVVQGADGEYSFLVAEGKSVSGPILEIGNTNSRYRFPMGAKKFIEAWNVEGPAHHCAIGTGHITGKLTKLAAILGINIKVIR